MFYTLSETNFAILATLKLSSANALNLGKSNNLSFGKELKGKYLLIFICQNTFVLFLPSPLLINVVKLQKH